MIELKQDKIWTDSLSSALGLDNPWDELEKPLRKFICFGAGDAGADGEGGGENAAPYGQPDQDLDAPTAPAGPTGPGGTSPGDFGGEFGGFGGAFGGLPGVSGPASFGGATGSEGGGNPAHPYSNYNKALRGISRTALKAITPNEVVIPSKRTPPTPYVPDKPPPPKSWARSPLAPIVGHGIEITTHPIDALPTNPFAPIVGPYGPQAPPIGFGPVSRSDIASRTGTGQSINPGFTPLGYNTGIGRGVFGGYTSSDPATAQADVDAGLATSDVGSFDIGGLFSGLATTALGILGGPVVSGALALGDAVTGVPGTGTFGAVANAVQGNEAALTRAHGGSLTQGRGIVGMASGGGLKDALSFASPAFNVARTIKKDGIEGLLSFFSPAFALSGGKLPLGLDNLLGGSSEAQAPAPAAVRSAEVPVEASPAPTIGELEEMQNIAVMQQVLAGQPVEAQMGGLVSAFAMGGVPSPYFEGRVMGTGDGMSDSIPFSIEGQQPAILSRDEYVLPADIVSMMGNGSSDAGAGKIDSFINDFRVQKYGRGEQPPETSRGLSSIG